MDPVRQLYDQLLQQGQYTKSFEEFQSQFATAGAQQQLYDKLHQDQMYTRSLEEFQSQFFTPKAPAPNPERDSFMVEATQRMSKQQAEQAWEMTQPKKKEEQFITGAAGDFINSLGGFGDFIDDMYGYVASGYQVGQSQDEVLSAAFAAPEDLTEEMISDLLQQTKDQGAKTEEMLAYQKQIEEGGDTWGNTLYAYWQNPSVIFGQALEALSMRFNETSAKLLAGGVATGAATGSGIGATAGSVVVPGIGTGVGAGGGAIVGGLGGLRVGWGLTSGAMEGAGIVVDQLRERAQREGREYNEDTLAEYLTDREFMKKVRRNAIAGGSTVAVIDTITGGLGSAVARKQVAKGASKTAVAVTAALLEGTGGSIGEAAKQKVIGQELSPSEILAEFVAGTPGAGLNVLINAATPGSYTVTTKDGKKVHHDRRTMAEFIDNSTPEQLQDVDISIEKDKDLLDVYNKKKGSVQQPKVETDVEGQEVEASEELQAKRQVLERHRNGEISDQERDDLMSAITKSFDDKKREEVKSPPRGRRLFSEPAKAAQSAARKFRENAENAPEEGTPIRKIDKDNAMRIADAFEAMEHNPDDPEVREAYEAMAAESEVQYMMLQEEGVEVEIYEGDGEPYANSQEMLEDLNNNNHLYILSTEKDFGQAGITESQRAENPLLNESKFTDKNGKPMLINDVFRAVHDFFGHGERGNSFGPIGEENAWDVHARMFTPKARRAMTTETRGQNSWVNYGPQMRAEDGSLIQPNDPNYLSAKDRAFAEQKMGLLPEEFSELPSQGEPKTPKSKVAEQVGVSPRNLRDLVKTYQEVFGLDLNEALSAAVVSDRMVATMAERNGITKEEQYGQFEFVQSPDGLPKEVNESNVLFQGNFSDPRSRVTFSYDKNGDLFANLEKEGKITRDMSLSEFPEDADFVLHSPDDAFSGEIYKDGELLVEGQGGMYYPIKYNDKGFVWAGTGKGTASKLAQLLNESAAKSKDGKARLALTTGTPTKNLSTLKSANAVVETLFGFAKDPSFGVTRGQVERSIKRAAKKAQNKKGTKALPFDIPPMLTDKELISFLRDALRPPLSFDDRRAFVLQVLNEFAADVKSQKTQDQLIAFFGEGIQNKSPNYKAKPGRKLSATALTEGFAYMLGEPLLRDVTRDGKSGRVYAVVEVSRPEGLAKNQDLVTIQEDSTHESYPFAIKAADGAEIKLHVLDEVTMWNDAFQDPNTGGDIAQSDLKKLFPTSGLAFNTFRRKGRPMPEKAEPSAQAPITWEETPVRNMRESDISVRKDVISEAAADLKNGKITTEEYIAVVREYDKTGPIGQFFAAVSEEHMNEALNKRQMEKAMAPLVDKEGNPIQKVGLRLDIPAYLNANAWIVSMHDGPDGAPVSYRPAARITNVEFSTDPRLALQVASNAMNKATFARMVGDNVEIPGATVEEVGRNGEKMIEAVANDPAWVQVGMNPFRHSYFYDRATMQPVVAAAEVIQVGGLVYAKDVEYASPTDDRFMVRAEPSGKVMKGKEEGQLKASPEPLLDKNGDPVYFQDERAAIVMQNGKFIVHALTSPNVSSPVHEMAHAYETVLTDSEKKDILEWAGESEWSRSVSEKFARGFENYLATEEAPTPKLQAAFANFKRFMIDIYNGITGSDIDLDLNDPMKRIYENMLGSDAVTQTSTERTNRSRKSADGGNKKGRIRRFANRVATDMPGARKDIIENPQNYFEPQVLAEIQEGLESMEMEDLFGLVRETSLVNLSKAQNEVGVLAGIELINRAAARGDMAMVGQITADLAEIGTSAGRILRHFGELKSSTPIAMFEVIRDAVERNGDSLTENDSAQVMAKVTAVLNQMRQIKELNKKLRDGVDLSDVDYNNLEKALADAQSKLANADRDLIRLTNVLIEDGWGSIGTQLMQGNLMTTMSQVTNVFANLVNLGVVLPMNILSSLTESSIATLGRAFGRSTPNARPLSLGAFYHGLKGMGQGFSEAMYEVRTGQSKGDTEWRIQRGFFPLMSLAAAMGRDGALTKLGLDSDMSSSQRAKLFVKGTLGIPAEVMFRLLSLGDAPFRKFSENYSVYKAAKQRGLKGRDFDRFVKHPPFSVMEQAAKEGRELTFQEQTAAAKLVEGGIGNLRRAMENAFGPKTASALNFLLIRTQLPFVRTPVNIMVESVKYTVPGVAIVDAVHKFSKGETTQGHQSLAKAIIGITVAKFAEEMMREGLMSGEIEWEPKESKKNIAYDQFPPNSINIDGLRRYMRGEDPAVQPGDQFYSYQKMGLVGVMMGATATGYDGEANVSEESTSLLGGMVGIKPATTVNYVLNQGFLTGMNNLAKIFGETNEDRLEKAIENWMGGMFSALTATALPNTTAAAHRAQRTYMPDYRVTKDMTSGERIMARLKYTILDRTYGMSANFDEGLESVPVRVNWKGEPIRQTPEGADPIAYNLFDVTKARRAESDPVSNEIYRLYSETDVLSNVVSTPYYARNRSVTVPKTLSRKDIVFLRRAGREYSFMNDPEFAGSKVYLSTDIISELMKVSGQQRYAEVQALMNSQKYQNMTDLERVAALDEISDDYNGVMEYTRTGLKDHSILLLDAMQMIYERRNQN